MTTERLLEILAEAMGDEWGNEVEDLDMDEPLPLDSISFPMLVSLLSGELGREVEREDLDDVYTLGDLERWVNS